MGSRSRRSKFRGIVVARRNKGYASSVTLRNVVQGTAIERVLPLYSPHLLEVRARPPRPRPQPRPLTHSLGHSLTHSFGHSLTRSLAHKLRVLEKRSARRAKLYFLRRKEIRYSKA